MTGNERVITGNERVVTGNERVRDVPVRYVVVPPKKETVTVSKRSRKKVIDPLVNEKSIKQQNDGKKD